MPGVFCMTLCMRGYICNEFIDVHANLICKEGNSLQYCTRAVMFACMCAILNVTCMCIHTARFYTSEGGGGVLCKEIVYV